MIGAHGGRAARRGGRRAFTLAESVFAALLVCLLGAAAMRAIGTLGRGAAKLRAHAWLSEISVDLLDLQAAGGARELLTHAPVGPWTYERDLTGAELELLTSARGHGVREEIAALSPRITLTLEVEPPRPGQLRVRFGRLACAVEWTDPVAGRRRSRISTLTDSL